MSDFTALRGKMDPGSNITNINSKIDDVSNDNNNKTTNTENYTQSYTDKTTDNYSVNTEDCVIISEKNKNGSNNKYLINSNFNQNHQPTDNGNNTNGNEDESSSMQQSWLPSILKGEIWPEENTDIGSKSGIINDGDIVNGKMKDGTDLVIDDSVKHVGEEGKEQDVIPNPLLSVRDTVLWKNDTNARQAADWKKYKEDNFFKMINNNKLKDIPSNESTIPNTFANKFNKLHNEGLSAGKPDSPLKLFDVRQNTYTKYMMHNMLNQLSPKKDKQEVSDNSSDGNDDGNSKENKKLPKVLKQSDELYNKILTGSSSGGGMMHNNNNNNKEKNSNIGDIREVQKNITTPKNEVDPPYPEKEHEHLDMTSDAEEFSSFPSTTRKFVHDGEQLFENIRDGYQNGQLPITKIDEAYSQSDYTSEDYDDDDGVEGENESTRQSEHPILKAVPNVIDAMRDRVLSQAEQYNAEFNVFPPKLQTKYRVIEEKENVDVDGKSNDGKPKGLNFIPADEYRNKIYDKKLKKFVTQNEYEQNHTTSSTSYTNDDLEIMSDDGVLDNLSMDDPDKTSNSILRNSNSVKKLNQEVKFGDEIKSDDENSNVTIDATNITMTGIDESFSISDGLLVEAISESYPADDWSLIKELDLSEFGLKQVYHLDKMTPNLWYLNAANNEIQQNFGIPKGIQVLNLSNNKFDSLSAKFDKFRYLQVLNLSFNGLKDLRCLKELKNLTSLNLSNNRINNIEFLGNFKMLHYLNLSNNKIGGEINFRNYTLWFLEDLILDNNNIEEINNLSELPQLINFSINTNQVKKISYLGMEEAKEFVDVEPHVNLKRISLNNNEIEEGGIELIDFPELKEVQIDGCLGYINHLSHNTQKLAARYINKEENIRDILKFSLQSNDLKKLYLTGGILPMELPNFKDKFSSLSILDISAMNLDKLPSKFSEFFPLLIDLNLNFNRLSNLKGLEGMRHLKELKVLGNNIGKLEDVTDYTSNIRMCLKLLDLRVNPLTQKFYPFVFYGDGEGDAGTEDTEIEEEEEEGGSLMSSFQLQDPEDIEAFSVEYGRLYSAAGVQRWAEKSVRHMRGLSRETRQARAAYVMLALVWFEHVTWLDGARVTCWDRRAFASVGAAR